MRPYEIVKGPRKERYNTLRIREVIGLVFERIVDDPKISLEMDRTGVPARPARNRKMLIKKVTGKAIKTLFVVISEKVTKEHVLISIINFGTFYPRFVKKIKSNAISTIIGFARYVRKKKYKERYDTLRIRDIVKLVYERIADDPAISLEMDWVKVPKRPAWKRKKLIKKITERAIKTLFVVISEKVTKEHIFVSIVNFGTFSPKLIKKVKSGTIITRIGFARYIRNKKERR